MEPILAGDGSPSKAMVYTAFAAKENGSDFVHGEYRNIDYLISVAVGHTGIQ